MEAKTRALEAKTTTPIAVGYGQGFAGTETPITADKVSKQLVSKQLVSKTTNLNAGTSRNWRKYTTRIQTRKYPTRIQAAYHASLMDFTVFVKKKSVKLDHTVRYIRGTRTLPLILSANGNGIHDVHDTVLLQDNKRAVLPEKSGKQASSNERTKHINMGMIPVQDPGPKSGKLGMTKSKPKKAKRVVLSR
jgi:hypothetical protein